MTFHHVWIAKLQSRTQWRDSAPGLLCAGRASRRPDRAGCTHSADLRSAWRMASRRISRGCHRGSDGAPRVSLCENIDAESYARRQRSVVVRHISDDRIVALIEILSPGNKSSYKEFRTFLAKAVDASLSGGITCCWSTCNRGQLAIRTEYTRSSVPSWEVTTKPSPPDKHLTLVAYDAGPPKTSLRRARRGWRRVDRHAALSRSGLVRLRPAREDLSRPLIAAFLADSARSWSRRRQIVDAVIKTRSKRSRRLDLSGLLEPQVVDCLIAQHVLADLAGDGPRQRLDDHDVLRDLEVGDLTVAVLFQIVGLHARAGLE